MKDFHWFPMHLIFRRWTLKLRSTYINRTVYQETVTVTVVGKTQVKVVGCSAPNGAMQKKGIFAWAHWATLPRYGDFRGGGELKIISRVQKTASTCWPSVSLVWKTIGTSFVMIPSSSVNHLHDLQYWFDSCLHDILHVCKYNDPYIYNKYTIYIYKCTWPGWIAMTDNLKSEGDMGEDSTYPKL